MTPEAKVKKAVKKVLDGLSCYHFSPQTGGFGKSGVPDIIACYKSKFVAIECKAGKNKVTALQAHNLELVSKSGGFTFVANESNIDELETLMKELYD